METRKNQGKSETKKDSTSKVSGNNAKPSAGSTKGPDAVKSGSGNNNGAAGQNRNRR